MNEAEERDWGEYNSGPFCRHWHDPCDCDMICECGHECFRHGEYVSEACNVEGCPCEQWLDAKGEGEE